MRKFEKISYEQFKNDIEDNKELYESYNLPKRSTKTSAGYDFESLIDFTLEPGGITGGVGVGVGGSTGPSGPSGPSGISAAFLPIVLYLPSTTPRATN